ncbi:LysR family transcriptional regulator [Simiduia sp. 21SJ11W-1]|uniref:LysR family transcriptional regulator n=1 Tax=Simiduia sp. 21SJ11W-1 TaxID=2909669 RepID=UPI0020A0AE81|nr:LysR family transcriptional regulator [Simiduia sp. 21SJ11W-1]UTA47283.1 LysR family transcriptional regulator [Simiduia sp. 21SJ11W-1]
MDVRQLRMFVAVVDSGSFTGAAEKLHIAQSAVSIAIKKLEADLGITLFDRAERQIRLTAEGEVLNTQARQLLQAFNQTRQQLQELKGGERGTVRLGTSAMLGSYYLPRRIAAFRARYPGITFQVNGEGTNRAQAQLMAGEIDMAMINLTRVPEALAAYPLINEPIVACVAKDHPLATRKAIDFATFARQPLALYGEGYYLRELVNDQCAQLQLAPEVVLETNILRLMMSLVLAKEAVGFALARVAEQEPGLHALPFTQPLTLKLGIAWRKDSYLSIANRLFADFLLAEEDGQRGEGR